MYILNGKLFLTMYTPNVTHCAELRAQGTGRSDYFTGTFDPAKPTFLCTHGKQLQSLDIEYPTGKADVHHGTLDITFAFQSSGDSPTTSTGKTKPVRKPHKARRVRKGKRNR